MGRIEITEVRLVGKFQIIQGLVIYAEMFGQSCCQQLESSKLGRGDKALSLERIHHSPSPQKGW